ncbi:small rab-related gtpase [Anaeramoeba ignava]|uniref:Small rab-related gtpase n=1 Tax=Anaeramoeba ignava TaxID=1746090 RepID=A0A9Q0R6M6_ANAIG|nr:small rab-related gtpase [Anaeramoeba ignava]
MESENYDYLLKLLVVGDSAVGKTSLILRIIGEEWDSNITPTLAIDFFQKIQKLSNGKTVKIAIWDTVGQERFRTLTNSYYRGANGIILVYNVENRDTFDHLSSWIEEIRIHGGKKIPIIIVGNKIDQFRSVSFNEASIFASERDILYAETSSKTQFGVKEMFELFAEKIIETKLENIKTKDGFVLKNQSKNKKNNNNCC